MDEVAVTGEELVITKRGKPVARLVPAMEERPSLFGSMKGTVKIMGDIIEPIWERRWEEDMLKNRNEVHSKGSAKRGEEE